MGKERKFIELCEKLRDLEFIIPYTFENTIVRGKEKYELCRKNVRGMLVVDWLCQQIFNDCKNESVIDLLSQMIGRVKNERPLLSYKQARGLIDYFWETEILKR